MEYLYEGLRNELAKRGGLESMKRIDRIRHALKNTDGRLLATLIGLAVIAAMNLVVAYNNRSLSDAIVVVAIFLVVLPWLVLRRFRAKRHDGAKFRTGSLPKGCD